MRIHGLNLTMRDTHGFVAMLCVILALTIFTNRQPIANAQPLQMSRRIWCTVYPDTITGNVNETHHVILTVYANYQTQISWVPEGPYAPWDQSQIQIYGSPPCGIPLLTNSTVELSIVVPLAIGQHSRRLMIYDVEDPNWLNYTTITVTTLLQAPGIDFGFEIDHRDIYFDVSKNTLMLDAMGRIYCQSFHIFSINVTHNAPGLSVGGGYWMDGHNTCGPTSPADPNCLCGIQFTIEPSKVLNGTYPVEFTVYTNSTNSMSVMVRVHIRVMITKAWVSPQSPLWGEEVTVYANITRGMHIAWARLFYSIDKGISWRMEYMRPYWPEADLYAGYIPSQMVGTEVLYYVEASDRSGNMEKYPHSIVYDTQTYTVGMPVWAMAFAFLMVITATVVIVTIRRKHLHLPQPHYHHLHIMDKRINRRMRPIFWGSALTFAGIFLTFLISEVLSGYGRYIVTGPPFSPSEVDVPPFYMPLAYVGMFALYLIYFSLPIAIAIESYLYFKGRKGEGKKELLKGITIILAACASLTLIIALTLNAYIISIAQIHRIKLGEVIIDWYTFNGFIDNDTMAMGISFVSNSSVYVKVDKLPFSFGYGAHKVTIYRYGPDWLELSIGERG